MSSTYKQVSRNVVIESSHPEGKDRYFSRITSKPDIDRMFEDDERKYGILTSDVFIELQNGNLTPAIIISFESGDDTNCHYFDLLISEIAGFYISDWY